MESFTQGCICSGFLIASVFFLRYWKETRDRLFILFALAFFMLGLNRGLLVALGEAQEHQGPYLVRLAAFLIILVAIIDKNLRPIRSSDDDHLHPPPRRKP